MQFTGPLSIRSPMVLAVLATVLITVSNAQYFGQGGGFFSPYRGLPYYNYGAANYYTQPATTYGSGYNYRGVYQYPRVGSGGGGGDDGYGNALHERSGYGANMLFID